MRWLLDLLYLLAATLTAPIWLVRMIQTGKIRTDWPARLGRVRPMLPPPDPARPRLVIHAVSVGEVNAIRQLVEELRDKLDLVIAVTTDTGTARAKALWAMADTSSGGGGGNGGAGGDGGGGGRGGRGDRGGLPVVRYPLDFSWAVARFVRAVQPDAVALTELEVWPNFTAACQRHSIPVCVINGRLTERSFRGYRRFRAFIRPMFSRLTFVAAQNHAYAQRFAALGVAEDRVHVMGTMKWDTARIVDHVEGTEELARALGIDRSRPLIVAGSTAPGEHELLHAATPPGVQLLCAPRKPEWFDQAEQALPGCVRRTRIASAGAHGGGKGGADRFLLDTIGELRMAYALADVVVIGRSFGQLHGSDMMEPASLGKAVIVGPRVSDFQDTVDALLAGDGLVQTTAEDLPRVLRELLDDPDRRNMLARNARAVIAAHQGATHRHAEMLLNLLRRD